MLRLLCMLVALAIVAPTATAALPIDFDTQIVSILTRHGCNAGSCHGAAVGRGGFKLSLLGSDAAADHDMIAHQLEGRRINLQDPDLSLLLRKPSEQTGHEGGLVLSDDSSAYELVKNWISQGAQRLKSRKLVRFELHPNQARLEKIGETIPLSATATFDDGSSQDVTNWTVFKADDPDAVQIDLESATVTVARRGVHVVIARYLDQVQPIRLVVPLSDRPLAETPQVKNRIDGFVNAQLQQLNLPASPPADDYAMVRRLTLDLTGRLPTPEQSRQYVADDSADKRSRLIQHLMSQPSFSDYWALKWANVLGIDSKQLQPEGADAYHRWLAERIAADEPVDESTRTLLTATGDSYVAGAVNFSRTGSSPGDLAEHASRVFMGVRLRCANCHNHPLDHWKQDDYHGLAAIFAKVKRGRVVTISQRGEVTHPVTGQPAVARIPGQRYLSNDQDGREALADWLTSQQTPYLARVTVNRLWQQLMGRGLVEPVDDIRVTNPATHPELLEWLAADFVQHGYRIKHTIALLCNSAAYGRDSLTVAGNQADTRFYSHAQPRRLEAEVIADAIGDVTGVSLELGDSDRAVRLTDNRFDAPSLDVLGRCDRAETCGGAADSSVSLARSLHLINGPLINRRLNDSKGRLVQLLRSTADNNQVLDELYLLTMSRPAPREEGYWTRQMNQADLSTPENRQEFFEDVLWSLMTSDSFATNH